MKRRATVALAAALVVGGLAGCDSTTEPAEVTVTERVEVAPKPTRESRPETPSVSISDREITALALELVWEEQSSRDKESMCWALSLDEDAMIDVFMEGAGPDFDRKQVRDFFREKC